MPLALTIFVVWAIVGPFSVIGLLSISQLVPDWLERIIWRGASIVGGPLFWLLMIENKLISWKKNCGKY